MPKGGAGAVKYAETWQILIDFVSILIDFVCCQAFNLVLNRVRNNLC